VGYPYQQLVTILTKKTEAGILKTFIAIAFKKISYPLSTISYPYQQLVTLSSTISYPLLASHSTGYTSSAIGYTCYSKTPTTMGKTYFLLKLLQNLFKNLVNIQEYHYGY
jgi:hypothetical protein